MDFSWLYSWLFKKKPQVVVPAPAPVPAPEVPPSGGPPVARKALLVGINKYPGAPLSGCVNDSYNVREVLIQDYAFKSEDIMVLLDGAATTKNILEKLEWLIKDAKAGDYIVFWFSGHGTQVALGDPTEPDGLNECICPVDFNWKRDKMIIDEQFAQIFGRLPEGVIFNWGSDSCHSGDLTKSIEASDYNMGWFQKLKSWFGVRPVMKSKQMPWMPPSMAHAIRIAKSMGFRTKGLIGSILDVGYVSGCRSDQTSADTEMDGKPCGALTYFFIKTLRSMKMASLREVVMATSAALARYGYSQSPQVEGARVDKPFLGR